MLNSVQNVYSELPVAERTVMNFIIENPNKVLFMTVRELAVTVGVSEGTVVRMAQRCGFRGFSDFKIQLAVDYENEKSVYQLNAAESEFSASIKRVFETHQQALLGTYQNIDYEVIEKVSQLIHQSRKTEFYGVGGSGLVALDAAHKLQRMDIPAWGFNDPHTQLARAAMMSSGCVTIGISHSGMTKDTLEALQVAKRNGATTISITSNGRSPIGKISDYILKTYVNEPILRSGSVAARIAQALIIDSITVGIHMLRKDETERLFSSTSSAVIDRKTGGEYESTD